MFDFWSDLVCIYLQIAGCRGCRLRKRKVLHPQVQVLHPLNFEFPRACLCDSRFGCFSFSFFPLFSGEEKFSPLSRREVLSQCSLAPVPSYYAPFFSPLLHPLSVSITTVQDSCPRFTGFELSVHTPHKGVIITQTISRTNCLVIAALVPSMSMFHQFSCLGIPFENKKKERA